MAKLPLKRPVALFILTLMALVLIKGFLFAALLPAWEGDDETAYWADIRTIVGEPGAWQGTGATIHGRAYPTIAAPVYLLTRSLRTETRLFCVRLLGTVFLAGAVFFTYLGAKELWPNSIFCQAAAPLFVAFNPKLSVVMASVSSDAFLIFMISAFFYLMTSFVIKPSRAKAAWFIPVLTVGALTKSRFLVAFPLLALTLLILGLHFLIKTKGFKEHRQKILLGAAGAAWLVWRLAPQIAGIFSSVPNYHAVLLAVAALDSKVLFLISNREFEQKMFRQFWGFFTMHGGIHLSESMYKVLSALTVAAGAGWLFRVYRAGRWLAFAGEAEPGQASGGLVLNIKPVSDGQWRRVLALTLNLVAIGLVIVAAGALDLYAWSSLGRYFLIGVFPISLFLAAGLDGFLPQKIKGGALIFLAVGFCALNILSVTAFLMPRFY